MATFQKFTRIKFSRTQDFRKLQYLFQVFPLLFFSQLPRDNEGLLTMNRLKCTMNHNRRNWKSKSFIWNIYFRESLVEKKNWLDKFARMKNFPCFETRIFADLPKIHKHRANFSRENLFELSKLANKLWSNKILK